MLEGGLPHDIMHDVFEGIAPLEIKLLLRYCVENNFFTLSHYNDRLVNLNSGYSEHDKPVPILSKTFNTDKSLKGAASHMMLLV